jgi:hypothetical protein
VFCDNLVNLGGELHQVAQVFDHTAALGLSHCSGQILSDILAKATTLPAILDEPMIFISPPAL